MEIQFGQDKCVVWSTYEVLQTHLKFQHTSHVCFQVNAFRDKEYESTHTTPLSASNRSI